MVRNAVPPFWHPRDSRQESRDQFMPTGFESEPVGLEAEHARRLAAAAADGDAASFAQLLEMHRPRLRRLIVLRISPSLSRRVDEEDILQEVYLHASQHLVDFIKCADLPFFVWLRGVALHVLLEVHRRHLDTQMRNARREVHIANASPLDASSQISGMAICRLGNQSEQRRSKARMGIAAARDHQ